MKKRVLGSSGLQVSEIGLGCNALGGRIDHQASRKVVSKALDLGITLFDTADSYGNTYGSPSGSEICLGKLLGDSRKNIILATKFGNAKMPYDASTRGGASRRVIMLAVEASLKRLKTDWIDLYQPHEPDPLTPIEETLRALDDLVRQGKVRYIGCSNFTAWPVVEAHWTAKHLGLNAFVSCQDEYSLLARNIERDLLPAMHACGLGLLPYLPLAAGLLTGKYKRNASLLDTRLAPGTRWSSQFITDANWTITERLETSCAERGRSLLELAFGWLLAHPIVASVIAGATRPEQLELNVRAGECVLTAEDMAQIDSLTSMT
ncbi:MAG: aldo/keto reductase [Betaproteobacteria bacterium]|nr:aldo/keto reductase [Betaproteobacteria bacterium]